MQGEIFLKLTFYKNEQAICIMFNLYLEVERNINVLHDNEEKVCMEMCLEMFKLANFCRFY